MTDSYKIFLQKRKRNEIKKNNHNNNSDDKCCACNSKLLISFSIWFALVVVVVSIVCVFFFCFGFCFAPFNTFESVDETFSTMLCEHIKHILPWNTEYIRIHPSHAQTHIWNRSRQSYKYVVKWAHIIKINKTLCVCVYAIYEYYR